MTSVRVRAGLFSPFISPSDSNVCGMEHSLSFSYDSKQSGRGYSYAFAEQKPAEAICIGTSILLEGLYSVCLHMDIPFPFVRSKTCLLAEMSEEIFRLRQLFPDLREECGAHAIFLDDHSWFAC